MAKQAESTSTNPALNGTPNTEASARTLEELAYMASASGEETAAHVLMDLAVRADLHASRRINFAFQGVPGLGMPFGSLPTVVGGKHNLDGGLSKAIAKNSFRARKTPYKINPTLYAIGAYDGIRDPAQATQMTMRVLQNIARHPIMHAIIETRVRQIAPYCKIAHGPNDLGFEVRLRDKKQRMTRAARARKEEIENILLHGGLHRDPWGKRRRHSYTGEPGVWDGNEEETALSFSEAVEVETRDLLTCGWSCSRIEAAAGDAEKFPITFYSPVDSALVRLTEPEQYGEPKIDSSLRVVKYVEMSPDNNMEVFREYSWDMMSVMLYRRRMDWFGRGYGDGLVEPVLDTLAAMSDSLQFCKEFYDNSHLPFGILEFSGFPMLAAEQYLQSIKQEMLRSGGKGNWWNVIAMMFPMGPNGQSGGVNFKPFRGEAASEMSGIPAYWTLLNTILHATCLIDPNETGFESHTTKNNALQEADPSAIIEESHSKGHKPLLEKHQARRNNDVVWRIDEDFEMGFVNVEGEDEKKKEELAQLKLQRGWTPDRVADYFDEEPMWYPLDPVVYGQCEAKYSEEDYDTIEEYKDAVVKEYEEQCKRRGYVKYWSGVGDLPVLCPSMMQVIQAEQAENQQATGQGMPQQGQMMPGQGMPGMDGQMGDAGQMEVAPVEADVDDAAQEQTAAQPVAPGADLRPHHFLGDEQEASDGDDEGDDERRKRYAAALKQRLLQQAMARQQDDEGLSKSMKGHRRIGGEGASHRGSYWDVVTDSTAAKRFRDEVMKHSPIIHKGTDSVPGTKLSWHVKPEDFVMCVCNDEESGGIKSEIPAERQRIYERARRNKSSKSEIPGIQYDRVGRLSLLRQVVSDPDVVYLSKDKKSKPPRFVFYRKFSKNNEVVFLSGYADASGDLVISAISFYPVNKGNFEKERYIPIWNRKRGLIRPIPRRRLRQRKEKPPESLA